MKHTISVLVENQPGVLARIAGLFSARGYNIESLTVGETEEPKISRMTIVVGGDERVLEQVKKQLNRLIDVIKVQDFIGQAYIERDLVLIKVNASPNRRGEILQIAEIFRAKPVDIFVNVLTLEMTGDEDKIEAFIKMLKPFGIRQMVRTGIVAMARG